MVPGLSTSPSQMFQERIAINLSGKCIMATIFNSFHFYSSAAVRITYIFPFLQVQGYGETSSDGPLHGETSLLKAYIFASKPNTILEDQ